MVRQQLSTFRHRDMVETTFKSSDTGAELRENKGNWNYLACESVRKCRNKWDFWKRDDIDSNWLTFSHSLTLLQFYSSIIRFISPNSIAKNPYIRCWKWEMSPFYETEYVSTTLLFPSAMWEKLISDGWMENRSEDSISGAFLETTAQSAQRERQIIRLVARVQLNTMHLWWNEGC